MPNEFMSVLALGHRSFVRERVLQKADVLGGFACEYPRRQIGVAFVEHAVEGGENSQIFVVHFQGLAAGVGERS
jgi:hypothetical protein